MPKVHKRLKPNRTMCNRKIITTNRERDALNEVVLLHTTDDDNKVDCIRCIRAINELLPKPVETKVATAKTSRVVRTETHEVATSACNGCVYQKGKAECAIPNQYVKRCSEFVNGRFKFYIYKDES